MASGIAAQVFAVFLGVLFIASGSVKTIKLNSSLYRELLKAFINLTNASPIRLLGLKTSPLVYMQTSGVIELICGTTLATGTLRSQSVACIGLMSLMFLTSYCHMVLGDVGSAVVPIGYLVLLYWLHSSLKSRQSESHSL
uniref:Na_H_Exchanger domain-containing protein n=1 Tax=Mesocestoides corti TaxID=53468 RepID=A0A5K3F5P3_MESCO